MTPDRFEQIDVLAEQAKTIDASERLAWLRIKCASDEDLYNKVCKLLYAKEQAQAPDITRKLRPDLSPVIEAEREGTDTTDKFCPRCRDNFSRDITLCPKDGAVLSLPDPYGLAGTTLNGKYEVRALVSAGGMGLLYQGFDKSLGRLVAIKVPKREMRQTDAKYIEHIKNEAQAHAQPQHENIVNVYELGTAGEDFYLVMEWLEGRTLAEEIETSAPLAPGRTIDILSQVARALDAAHSRGVFHLDIKPANIFLNRDDGGEESVKIVDFGIARMRSEGKSALVTSPAGTLSYASPEQRAQGARVDERSDIFSVGVVLSEMVQGTLAVKSRDPVAKALARLALKMKAEVPEERRPKQIRDLPKLLKKAAGARRQRTLRRALAFVIVALVFAGLIWYVPSKPNAEARPQTVAAGVADVAPTTPAPQGGELPTAPAAASDSNPTRQANGLNGQRTDRESRIKLSEASTKGAR
jgi:serine/threonine protein kinase